MKNSFLLLGFLLLFSCQSATNDTATSANSNETATNNLTEYTLKDVPNSTLKHAEKRDANGKLMEQGFFDGSEKTGTWVTYHPDSDLPASQASMVANAYNGQYTTYNKRGQIELFASYFDNELHGRYAKYKFGRVVEESNYNMGQLDGLFRSYFNNTDKIQREIEYKNGKQHGFWRAYNEEGAVVMEYQYENGEKVSGGIVE